MAKTFNALTTALTQLKAQRATTAQELEQLDSTITYMERMLTPTGKPAQVRKNTLAQRDRLKKTKKQNRKATARNIGQLGPVADAIRDVFNKMPHNAFTRDELIGALQTYQVPLGAVPARTVGLTLSMMKRMGAIGESDKGLWRLPTDAEQRAVIETVPADSDETNSMTVVGEA